MERFGDKLRTCAGGKVKWPGRQTDSVWENQKLMLFLIMTETSRGEVQCGQGTVNRIGKLTAS